MKRYMHLLLIFTVLIVLSASVFVTGAELARNYKFDTAVRLSRILDRQFVFSFLSSGCPHCQDYKEDILSDPEVKLVLKEHFVLSLVSVDETFKINLPEKGEVTNIQLASGLGLKGTPTTFIFYPPNPGLEGRGITKFSGKPPNPKSMVDFLTKIATESFREKEDAGSGFYNYETDIKPLTREEYEFLINTSFDIPVIQKERSLSDLPDSPEMILDFSEASERDFAARILDETEVKKVLVVEEEK